MKKRSDFNQLIECVKAFATERPAAYKKRVLLLGLLGYAYIFLVLGILILLIIGSVWIMLHSRSSYGAMGKLLIFVGFLAWLIVKSLWVRIEAPKGFSVTPKTAPLLFAVIEDICLRQKSPRPDVVLINNDFNAFISQVPRLGIFGWEKNYLVLGLPYMMASDPDQMKAVLAHEFGHFSGSHGRSGAWIYRIRTSLYNIMMNLENEWVGKVFFKWFFQWYSPYFNAYSFVLMREHEYEADRYASACVGAKVNAEELVNALIKAMATESYWKSVWSRVNDDPAPPRDVITGAVALLQPPVPEPKYRDQLLRALRFRTQYHDTHPCLKERLAALGYSVEGSHITDSQGSPLVCQKPMARHAAEEWLGSALVADVLRRFDAEWVQGIEAQWKERHDQVQKMKQELVELNNKSQSSVLSDGELVTRSYLIDQTSSKEAALAAIRDVLVRCPDHAGAHYRLGELLLEDYDEQGAQHLKRAMQLDASLASASLEKLSAYHESKGEYTLVEAALDNLESTSEKDQKDYDERNSLLPRDKFKVHGLPEEVVADICSQMKAFEKEVTAVYLIQKELTVYPENPLYVLVVAGRMKFFEMSAGDFNQKLANKLLTAIRFYVSQGSFYFSVGDQPLIKKARKIPGALIIGKQ